jgi:hypothetical protein
VTFTPNFSWDPGYSGRRSPSGYQSSALRTSDVVEATRARVPSLHHHVQSVLGCVCLKSNFRGNLLDTILIDVMWAKQTWKRSRGMTYTHTSSHTHTYMTPHISTLHWSWTPPKNTRPMYECRCDEWLKVKVEGLILTSCLLWIDKVRVKEKTYDSVSVRWWKTKK